LEENKYQKRFITQTQTSIGMKNEVSHQAGFTLESIKDAGRNFYIVTAKP